MKSRTLWYGNPARQWREALPIGNGRLGGMVFGNPADELIKLNDDTVWNGTRVNRNNPDAKVNLPRIQRLLQEGRIQEAEELSMLALSGVPNSQRSFVPVGELAVRFPDTGEVTEYRRALELDTGMASVAFQDKGKQHRREVFVSKPEGVLVMRLETEDENGISFQCRLSRGHNQTDEHGRIDNHTIYFDVAAPEEGVSFRCAARVSQNGGTSRVIGETLLVDSAKEATIYLTVETSFRTKSYREACIERLEKADGKGYEEIKHGHIEEYQKLFGSLYLEFGAESIEQDHIPTDERLERVKRGETDPGVFALYFQYGRYLLISSSREGSLPANLQGLWNESMTPPWDSKYTININTEMNYWMAESGNLSSCHLPLFDLLDRMKENGKRTAREMYGCRGSVAHHNTDLFADTAPQDLCITSTFWVMGEAWMATHIWMHYQYTKDRAFLRKYYDVLEQSVMFFCDFLVPNHRGELVVSPTISPENTYKMHDGTYGHLCEGCTMDTEILMELFEGYLKASRELGIEGATVDCAKRVMERFPKLRIGRNGHLLEWMEEYEEPEPGHRHISHLYGVYPGQSITWEKTPELMQAAKRSLERRLEYGGGHTGWSRAWIIGLWTHFREAEKAYGDFVHLLSEGTFPNMMDMHPLGNDFVFQIDGNLGAAAALIEMLVQATDEKVTLLPALPAAWNTGKVSGIRLPGNAELSMEWEQGEAVKVKITAYSDYHVLLVSGEKQWDVALRNQESWEYNS